MMSGVEKVLSHPTLHLSPIHTPPYISLPFTPLPSSLHSHPTLHLPPIYTLPPIHRLSHVQDFVYGHNLILAALKLLGFCVKLKVCYTHTHTHTHTCTHSAHHTHNRVLWCPQNKLYFLLPNNQVNRQYVVQPHLKTLDILLKTLNMVRPLASQVAYSLSHSHNCHHHHHHHHQ